MIEQSEVRLSTSALQIKLDDINKQMKDLEKTFSDYTRKRTSFINEKVSLPEETRGLIIKLNTIPKNITSSTDLSQESQVQDGVKNTYSVREAEELFDTFNKFSFNGIQYNTFESASNAVENLMNDLLGEKVKTSSQMKISDA